MKIKRFDERFRNDVERSTHFIKHISIEKNYNWSEEEYERVAEKLAKTPVDNVNIFGYMAEDQYTHKISYIKYDKNLELFTSYYIDKKERPITITAFRRSWSKYLKRKEDPNDRYKYIGEIKQN